MATAQYYLLHLLIFFCLFSYTLQDNTCRNLGCAEGKCVADDNNNSNVSYHCECNRGWKKMMVAPMPYPSCIVPNCTLNFACGGRTPPPPPPPPPPQQPFNNTNVCNFVWCGEGDCVAKGKTHDCQCHDDASNLNNNSTFICVKQCSFGADCKQLGINTAKPPSRSPPAPPPPPPPTSSSANFLCCGTTIFGYKMAQLLGIVVLFTSTVIAMT
ncbi:hypothetical protein SSX86_002346 [Deinandra increscens subsp. villosa]|uniref:EGF-like domain-containing protein n=1 Tax=Deinandra increscens subsp. villosa TaxID=3103831 RepID=A0AAP0DNW0_9ASTR